MTTTTYSAAAAIAAYQSSTPVGPYAIVDTEADVAANLSGLETLATAHELSSLTLSDPSDPLTLTYTSWSAARTVLSDISSYSVAVTSVLATNAIQLTGSHISSVSILDSAANVGANLPDIHFLNGDNVPYTITLTDSGTAHFTVSVSDWTYNSTVFPNIQGGNFTVTLAGPVPATSIGGIAGMSYISSVAVSDSGTGIGQGLDALEAAIQAHKLSSLTLTGTSPLPITVAQITSDADVLALLPSSYTLSISANAASATADASLPHVAAVSVTDISANLGANLDALQTLAAAGELGSVTQTDYGLLTVTAAQISADAQALAKFNFYAFDEIVSAAAAGAAIYQSKVIAVSISDTAADISANIATVRSLATALKVNNITVTDGGTLQVTDDEYNTQTNWRAFLTGNYSISISGVDYGAITSRLYDSHVLSLGILDSASYLSLEMDNLELMAKTGKLASISFTDSGTPILSLTSAQITSDADALALISSNYGLSGISIANAATLAANSHIAQIGISDSFANITAGMSSLQSLASAGKLGAIKVTDTGYNLLTVTPAQWSAEQPVLSEMTGNFGVEVLGFTAAQAASFSTATAPAMTVIDSAANVITQLDNLEKIAPWINSITFTDTTAPVLTLSSAQLTNDRDALAKIVSPYSLSTNGVFTIAALLAQPHLTTPVAITDSADNVQANLDLLQTDVAAGLVTGITLTDPVTLTLNITAAQMTKDAGALAAISSAYKLSLTGEAAGAASSIVANPNVSWISVSDSAANIAANLDTLQSLLTSGKVTSVTVTDGGAIPITQSQLTSDSVLLHQLQGSSYTVLQGITAAGAKSAGLQANEVAVVDSAANVAANLDTLENLTYGNKIASISLTDAGTPIFAISAAQLNSDQQAIAEITSSYKLALTGASANQFYALATEGRLASGSISDNAYTVSILLANLAPYASSITGITLTDGGLPTLAIAANQMTTDAPVLATISSPYSLSITGVSVANLTSTLAQRNVASVSVSDNSTNISADLDGLQTLISTGKLTSVNVTYGPSINVTQAQLTSDSSLLNSLTGSFGINLIGATAAGAASAAHLNHVTSVSVTDSAANVVANIAALETLAQNNELISITLTDATTPALALSATQLTADAQALATITSPYTVAATGLSVTAFLSPTNSLSSASIADTTANVLGNLDQLQASITAGKLTSIALTDGGTPSFTITNAQLTSDATALHDIVGSFSLAVSGVSTSALRTVLAASHAVSAGVADSAANIGGDLDTLQSLINSGKVTSIALTDSGTPTLTVTAAQMISDAQAINDIAGAYTLTVTGDATQISQLTPTALSHVKSLSVSDSAANISSDLDSLQSIAAAGKLTGVAVTGASFADLSVTTAQLTSDATVLKELTGNYVLEVTAPLDGGTITGSAGVGNIVSFSGSVSDYTITPGANGAVTVSSASGTEHLSGIDALQIGSQTDIVAATPAKGGTANTGNLTELYGAVFSRTPDVPGLGFYQAYLASNPTTQLTQFAQWFLDLSEYQDNTAHNYAQTTVGETQFITDSYQNLLHRTPTSAEVSFYLTNVIQSAVNGMTAGTTAYTTADAQAHALLLTYFSASSEFLGDVQITAQNPSSTQHWLLLTA